MYNAIVCRIKIFPHPNADNLNLGNAHGFQVIVSKDTPDGELGVFFPPDGQLSQEFCDANDLIQRVDEKGNRAGGYFSHQRKVRAQKFRGERSEGFYCPLSYFKFTGYDLSTLKEGDQFSILNEVPICNKYYTPATLRAISNSRTKQRKANFRFAEHVETKQLKYEISRIPVGSILYITEKKHGTSGRSGNILDDVEYEIPLWKRIFNFIRGKGFGKIEVKTEYNYLNGTRRTIIEKRKTEGFYGADEGFRIKASTLFKDMMRKGELVYYEIVGWTETGAPIMQPQATDIIKEKGFAQQYGSHMVYKYGCLNSMSDVYVYRIAMVNDDGVQIDLPWEQVKTRCKAFGVKPVVQLAGPIIYDGNQDALMEVVNSFIDGPSTVDQSHIREGVVVRVENGEGVSFLKAKSFNFGVLEGYIKDQDSYVDTEEAN